MSLSPAVTDATPDPSLVRHLGDEREAAATELYRRYADRIRNLARAQIPARLRGRADADDVVQSVFRAFFAAAARGLYDVADGESLWRLLAASTVNKVRSLQARHCAQRRDARSTVDWPSEDFPGSESHCYEVAVRELIERLSPQERAVVQLRLEGFEVAEIAERVGRSKRAVERLLQRSRNSLTDLHLVEK